MDVDDDCWMTMTSVIIPVSVSSFYPDDDDDAFLFVAEKNHHHHPGMDSLIHLHNMNYNDHHRHPQHHTRDDII